MSIESRIETFVKLGIELSKSPEQELQNAIVKSCLSNTWFTKKTIEDAITAITKNLTHEKLNQWLSPYTFSEVEKKKVFIIMAGNIPLVGFHDLLCVLISGHQAIIKLSSKDAFLMKAIVNYISVINPQLYKDIQFVEKIDKSFDAVIATGSNESFRQFDYYFKSYHKLLRKNRTSVAILDGSESLHDRKSLAKDIFMYYGLGCRNVSKIYVPKGYNLDFLFEVFFDYKDLLNNHKYANNYDYHKAIYMLGNQTFVENGFFIIKEDKSIHSPIGVLNVEYYETKESVLNHLSSQSEQIQCIVGKEFVPFGQAQSPQLSDYADGVDTLLFLQKF